MDSFGDRLRSERENRGLSIRDVAKILDVDRDFLRALEANDFDALPEEAVTTDCLHGYAECLEVDADLMIQDYLQERDEFLRRFEGVVAEPIPTPAASEIVTAAERRPRSTLWLAALGALALAILALFVAGRLLSPGEPGPLPDAPVASAPVETSPPKTQADLAPAPVEPQPFESKPAAEVAPDPAEPRSLEPKSTAGIPPTTEKTSMDPSAAAIAAPEIHSSLSIPDYGVGTAVVDWQLVGQSDRFTEGRRVSFWTRVQDGTAGDRIHHVWLREGVEAARVSLRIGGPSWRTHSTKTLHPGSTGNWAVEARDDTGRVVARSEFLCVP